MIHNTRFGETLMCTSHIFNKATLYLQMMYARNGFPASNVKFLELRK